ncbi:MAG: bifunctional UDP-sugar hydrolase/5'-nucleotidase [Alphaproteobacteria bacterium]
MWRARCLVVLAVAVCGLALVASAAAAGTRLTILHINDFHARYEPVDRFDATCRPAERDGPDCFGGAARLTSAIARERAAAQAAGRSAVVLSAGDQFQGSLIYTHWRGEDAAAVMNLIGFDAMALGNHEFDGGPAELARFVDLADFPVLAANVVPAAGSPLGGRLAASTIVERDGQRIAVIGAVTESTAEISNGGDSVRFLSPAASLRDEAARLTAAGVNKIIALTHVGIHADRLLARDVEGIDAIVGGHSHSRMGDDADGAGLPYPLLARGPARETVPVVTAYAFGRYLGRLDLDFDDDGQVVAIAGRAIPLDAGTPEDAAVAAKVTELLQPIAGLRARRVGMAVADIDGDRAACRARECEMGNLVAEAMLARMRPQGAQIALQNGGGIRASLRAGPVTMGDVLTVLPFQNTISIFGLLGADLVAALEHGVGRTEAGSGAFLQVAGLRYVWDPSRPPGSRLQHVEVREAAEHWQPVNPAAIYRVVTNDFLRGGGDGFRMLAEAAIDPVDFGPGVEDAVVERFARDGAVNVRRDGRIATP